LFAVTFCRLELMVIVIMLRQRRVCFPCYRRKAYVAGRLKGLPEG
jgi:hypothetical protein